MFEIIPRTENMYHIVYALTGHFKASVQLRSDFDYSPSKWPLFQDFHQFWTFLVQIVLSCPRKEDFQGIEVKSGVLDGFRHTDASWSEGPDGSSWTWFWPLWWLLAWLPGSTSLWLLAPRLLERTAYGGVAPSLEFREWVAVLERELSLESR